MERPGLPVGVLRRLTTLLVLCAALAPLGPPARPMALVAADVTASTPTPTPGAWSVQPAGRASAGTRRASFVMDAAPGAVVRDAVRVGNLSTVPLSFQVYGADAYNTPRDGALAHRQAGGPQKGIGAWVKLRTNALVVPPGRAADIPFTVSVPRDAPPGSHIGGIVALNNAVEQAGNRSGVDVGIQRAIAVRIQLTVTGPVTPGLAVRDVQVEHHPSAVPFRAARATVRYTLVNTGNTAVQPTARPRATGLFGRTLKTFPTAALPVLLPGERTRISVAWADAPPLDFVTASVDVTATGVPAASAQSRFVAVSWSTAAVLMGVLAVLITGLSQLRRRQRVTSKAVR